MDPGEQQTKNESTTAPTSDKDNEGFDFSAIMKTLARLEKSTEIFSTTNAKNGTTDETTNHKQIDNPTSNRNHDESSDDVNVPLEELPIETKDNLPAVILDNKQFDADEELVFQQRCKLYRFDTSDSEEGSQWKERGIGDLTIVRRSVGTNFAYRILMRRDKVFKLCANHFIRGDMKLKAHGKNNNSFLWSTSADLSENEPTFETLAARFKTVEDADRFKKAFEEAVEAMNKEANNDPVVHSQNENNEDKKQNDRHDSDVQEESEGKEKTDGKETSDGKKRNEKKDSEETESSKSTNHTVQNGTTKAD